MASSLDLLRLARQAAKLAGGYLRKVERPSDPSRWTSKGRSDFVTEVDQTAERMIRDYLVEQEPSSSVIGEELSPEVHQGGLAWIVDPLDGTTNFLHGVAEFAVSIAAAVDGSLVAGVVLEVPSDRLYSGALGHGSWLNQERIKVSSIDQPAHALIGTGFPFSDFTNLDRYLEQLKRIMQKTSGIRRPGSAALDLASVASAAFDGFWEQRLSAWDIAAGIVIVREAGGRVTDFSGRDLGVEHSSVVAGNPWIHDWLLRELAG